MGISYAVICLCHSQEAEKSTEFFHFDFVGELSIWNYKGRFVKVILFRSAYLSLQVLMKYLVNSLALWQPFAIVFTPTGFMWWKYPKTLSLHLSQLYYSVIWGYLSLRTWKTLYCSIIRLLVKPQLSCMEAWPYASAPRTKSNYQLLYWQQGENFFKELCQGSMGHTRD